MLSPAPPLVSVIIPNYNHAPYLQQRIESVLAQTWSDFEIILLDDCSTDNSAAVLNGYRLHEKVSHVVLNEENSGSPFKQWAKGIDLARGEWVWIAESDDWCEPTLLQTLLEGIEDDTAFSYCQSLAIQDNRILWTLIAECLSASYGGKDFVEHFMLRESRMYNASMCVFRRNLYNKVDTKYTKYKFCGDWLFWILLAQHGRVAVSGKVLNYFRKHDQDVSGKANKSGLLYKEYVKLLHDLVSHQIISQQKRVLLLRLKLTEMMTNPNLSNAVKSELKQVFFQALKGNLLGGNAFSVYGERLFAKFLLDFVRGNT